MYHIDIYKVLKNGPKIKAITSFERGEHIEYKYILKKGTELKNQPKTTLNDLYTTLEVKDDL